MKKDGTYDSKVINYPSNVDNRTKIKVIKGKT